MIDSELPTDLRRPCTPSRGPASAVLAHPLTNGIAPVLGAGPRSRALSHRISRRQSESIIWRRAVPWEQRLAHDRIRMQVAEVRLGQIPLGPVHRPDPVDKALQRLCVGAVWSGLCGVIRRLPVSQPGVAPAELGEGQAAGAAIALQAYKLGHLPPAVLMPYRLLQLGDRGAVVGGVCTRTSITEQAQQPVERADQAGQQLEKLLHRTSIGPQTSTTITCHQTPGIRR